MDAMPSKLSSTDADIPLGRTYGIRTLNDASSLRRQLGREAKPKSSSERVALCLLPRIGHL